MTSVADGDRDRRARQLLMPFQPQIDQVAALPHKAAAWRLCFSLSGLEPKEIYLHDDVMLDKGHFSRIANGQNTPPSDKQHALMTVCGNEAPLMWDVYHRGYDWHTLRRRKTELEKQLEAKDQEIAQLRMELDVAKRWTKETR